MTPWTLPALALAVITGPAHAAVDYMRDVKPILTQHCVRCHGAQKAEAGLRVDTAENLLTGGDSGPPVKLGSRDESMLVRLIVGPHEDIPQMPYKKPPLSAKDVAILREWVADGAAAPETEEAGVFQHWSFVPPKRVALPTVRQSEWPQNAIDNFVLARLEQDQIKPAPAADRTTLLRRVTLDLTGLPPTPVETADFLKDNKPDAYARVVERLLATPHYGERWARPWLDVARYGDSNGYSIDAPRQIWKYRDWVIDALNRDQPFNEFVIDQLAGDQRPNPALEQKVATGFNRNTQINQEGGIDPEQFRIEAVLDRVNTFGTAFLGLTIGCAQCHDHKFDPITQKEYYQLYAFFNNTVEDGHGKSTPGGALPFPLELEPPEALVRELEEARADLQRYLDVKGNAVMTWARGLDRDTRGRLSDNVRSIIPIDWEQQTLSQKRAIYAAFDSKDTDFRARNMRMTRLEAREPKPVTTLVMSELAEPRESFLFIKGDFTRRGEPVQPGTPAILPPLNVSARPNRFDLAKWVVDPANPLPARVTVNRIWQQYFGRGLVETENDFGTQGDEPSHPQLLDWLATEFVAQNWSMKAMHRLIVTSATYQQASHVRPDLEIKDPINKLLGRQTRLRLDGEVVRDVALAASGLLSSKLGGPPVFPPQPEGVMNLGQSRRTWTASKGEDRYRRGLYTHIWRATPHPAFAVFDAPDGFSSCTRRLRSNTPLQALTLLNDQQFVEFAEALAKRIQTEVKGDLAAQLDFAFRTCVSRSPSTFERERITALWHEQFAAGSGEESARRQEAWMIVARVLLNLDETITRE